jgi:hypothetical protein
MCFEAIPSDFWRFQSPSFALCSLWTSATSVLILPGVWTKKKEVLASPKAADPSETFKINRLNPPDPV